MKKICRKIILTVSFLIGLIFFAELVLYGISLFSPNVKNLLSREPEEIPLVISDKRLGKRPNPAYPGHSDEKGFRNPYLPEDADIVVLGDSQTYGTGVARDFAWPRRLADLGDWEVYNFAFGGYGPVHGLLQLEEALDLDPELVIEAFYTGNDLYDAYHLVYGFESCPELRNREETVLENCRRSEREEPMLEAIDEIRRLHPEDKEVSLNPFRAFLSKHSRLYALVRALKRRYARERWKENRKHNWEWIKEDLKHAGDKLILFDGGAAQTVLQHRYRLLALDQKDPRMAEGLRIVLEAIGKMNEAARSRGVNFAVLLLPTKELVFKDAVYENLPDIPESYSQLIENEQSVWKEVKDFLDSEGITYIDALPVLKKALREGNQPYWRGRDSHKNEIGHELVAELVLSEIQRKGILTTTLSDQ